MTSVYSFGEDSPLKFQISDKLAERYNQAVDQFFKAQTRFNQKFGRRWDPRKDSISVDWTGKQLKAWNDFAELMKSKIATEGPYHMNDIMDDFLVKNAVSAVAVASSSWGRVITVTTMAGALYGLLKAR